jgi:hypothetical protein
VQSCGILEKTKQDVFMVTLEKYRAAAASAFNEKIQSPPRMQPAINIVPQKYAKDPLGSLVFEIAVYLLKGALQKIGASVNVAQRVDPQTIRQAGTPSIG